MNNLLFAIGFVVLLVSITLGVSFYPLSVVTGLLGAVMMSQTAWDYFKK